MRLDSSSRRTGELSSNSKAGRIARGEVTPKHKLKTLDDGRVLRLRRVRRKKKPLEPTPTVTPNSFAGTNRSATTSELNKPAPVASKPDSVGGKKARYRSITPGTSQLVKRSTPAHHFRPMTTVEQTL